MLVIRKVFVDENQITAERKDTIIIKFELTYYD